MNAQCGVWGGVRVLERQLQQKGFEIIQPFLPASRCDHLIGSIARRSGCDSGQSANRRNLLLEVPEILAWARSPEVLQLLASRGHPPLAVTRAILFDKTPGANWPVSWHQDQTIAVVERVEVNGFNAWSVKQGIPHVRPPCSVLERMIILRLHLDDCTAANGALRVLPGSHRQGVLDDDDIERWKRLTRVTVCEIEKGGVLLLKPLLLHASPSSATPAHRRVLHIEYALDPLPDGLSWFANAVEESL